MSVPGNPAEQGEAGYISYLMSDRDSNSDGRIDQNDAHFVYISDRNGGHLTQVTDREVIQYQWIEDNTQLLLTFKSEDPQTGLTLGVYDIKTGELKVVKSLNNK